MNEIIKTLLGIGGALVGGIFIGKKIQEHNSFSKEEFAMNSFNMYHAGVQKGYEECKKDFGSGRYKWNEKWGELEEYDSVETRGYIFTSQSLQVL